MFKDIYIETERLIIRPFTMPDAPEFHRVLSQEAVMRYLPEDVMSLEEVEHIITWFLECYEKNTPSKIIKFTVAMVDKTDDRVIGWCGLGPVDYNPSEIELYYGLSEEVWGQGLASEAAEAMLEYAFSEIDLELVVALAKQDNPASARVLEKIGMVFQGKVESLADEHKFYEGLLYYSLSKEHYFSREPAEGIL